MHSWTSYASQHVHVATLNYDRLLYQSLIDARCLAGFGGDLVDGFLRSSGFSPANLEPRGGNDFGWYLHLHGTPLFIDDEKGNPVKQPMPIAELTPTRHLVLTHVAHKPSVIDSSPVLSEYWRRLRQALKASRNLCLSGYSGEDAHLNDLIQGARAEHITVVEWSGAGTTGRQGATDSDRQAYWRQKTGKETSVVRLENILDFEDWRSSTLKPPVSARAARSMTPEKKESA
jgi:hypothetical protein